jgi:hypothetical protein
MRLQRQPAQLGHVVALQLEEALVRGSDPHLENAIEAFYAHGTRDQLDHILNLILEASPHGRRLHNQKG